MRAALLSLLLLAACGYQPPVASEAEAPAYKKDLASCSDAAHDTVNKANARRALAWFASPVRRWGQIGEATSSCMAGKGYGQLRWCTADELRGGAKTGSLVVTASGVQCSEPPRRG